MYTRQSTLTHTLGPPGSEKFRKGCPPFTRKNWVVWELHVEIQNERELLKNLTMEDQVFFLLDADSLNQALVFSSVFYWKTPGSLPSHEGDEDEDTGDFGPITFWIISSVIPILPLPMDYE